MTYIHDEAILRHGGASGLRDKGLLASALARVQTDYGYTDPAPDLFHVAATYAHAICKNHPFIDGNKRTAHTAAHTFLLVNGIDLPHLDDTEAVLQIEALAQDMIDRDAYAAYLRGLA